MQPEVNTTVPTYLELITEEDSGSIDAGTGPEIFPEDNLPSDEQQDRPSYESLDPESLFEFLSRPPPVYSRMRKELHNDSKCFTSVQ